MVEVEERSVEECPARKRAILLQKRFQELITIIINDTEDTFCSLMEDLDKSKEPVKKLPSLLKQSTNLYHSQMARKSWNVPTAVEGSGNAGKKFVGYFDAPSVNDFNSLDIRQSSSVNRGIDASSLSSSNLNRDELEASERLQFLIEEELSSRRKEIVEDDTYVLQSKRTDPNFRSNNSYSQLLSKTSRRNLEDEHPTSTQRLDSLIKDELNRIKISTDVAKDQSNRRIINVNLSKNDDDTLQSQFMIRTYSPIDFSRRPKI